MAVDSALQGPVIPLLINNTVDPQDLSGGPLLTYAKYENPKFGDELYQRWLGRDQHGEAVDVTDIRIDVVPSSETPWGFIMPISNDLVWRLDKGQVFYSYYLKRRIGDTHEPRVESKRIHFGVGKAGLLPAPQVKESHDNQLNIDNTQEQLFTVAVAPYTAMANGDSVKLIWKGVRENGDEGLPVSFGAKVLNDNDSDRTNNPGQVLSWTFSKSNAYDVNGGSFTLCYEITYASHNEKRVTRSAERSIVVQAPLLPLLPAPSVKNLVGTEINPGQFPNGIEVVIPVYPGIRVGDDVLVYGTPTRSGINLQKNTIGHLKVDASNIESGKLEVPIAQQWLSENAGSSIYVSYQYARVDAAGTAAPLTLTVLKPKKLPKPTVDDSEVTSSRVELNPTLAIHGAYIVIPEAADIEEGDSITAYFKGVNASGSCEINEPYSTNPRKYKVPASVLPSNFGETVEVTYSVNGQMADSPLNLFILELNFYSIIKCEGVQVGSPATLKLSDIPAGGAQLHIAPWPFISTQQKVRLWLTSSSIDDRDIIVLRDVFSHECVAGISTYLTREDLQGISPNTSFTLYAGASFDGGDSPTEFNNPLRVKLLA